MLHGVYIVDADNTLWDTNEVFVAAQRKMVGALRENGCGLDDEAALQAIRALDLEIGVALNDFEYDFTRLACALLLLDQGLPGSEAVRLVTAADPPAREWARAQDAAGTFYAHLQGHVPRLFAGVPETLAALRSRGNVLVLHSEGLRARIKHTMAVHALEPLFDCLALERKSRHSFQRAREAGADLFRSAAGRDPERCIVVGDSPKRDIRFGNLIGATTVFKPGGWLGLEIPGDPLLTPDFTIRAFPELLELTAASPGAGDDAGEPAAAARFWG